MLVSLFCQALHLAAEQDSAASPMTNLRAARGELERLESATAELEQELTG